MERKNSDHKYSDRKMSDSRFQGLTIQDDQSFDMSLRNGSPMNQINPQSQIGETPTGANRKKLEFIMEKDEEIELRVPDYKETNLRRGLTKSKSTTMNNNFRKSGIKLEPALNID